MSFDPKTRLRNIAIIAHVDHGKTTLVDQLLKQSGTLDARKVDARARHGFERRSSASAASRSWRRTPRSAGATTRINIVDTPGHADFGGEVERVLSMVDCVLLLVDAVDGPMPQTRFVTQKAFAHGFAPLVVINKVDREGARPHWVLDQTFDLFDRLGASDKQLDFPVIYASALAGLRVARIPRHAAGDMQPLFEAIVNSIARRRASMSKARCSCKSRASTIRVYVGLLGIGRIKPRRR